MRFELKSVGLPITQFVRLYPTVAAGYIKSYTFYKVAPV